MCAVCRARRRVGLRLRPRWSRCSGCSFGRRRARRHARDPGRGFSAAAAVCLLALPPTGAAVKYRESKTAASPVYNCIHNSRGHIRNMAVTLGLCPAAAHCDTAFHRISPWYCCLCTATGPPPASSGPNHRWCTAISSPSLRCVLARRRRRVSRGGKDLTTWTADLCQPSSGLGLLAVANHNLMPGRTLSSGPGLLCRGKPSKLAHKDCHGVHKCAD